MGKATKVGKFRASSRAVRDAPLNANYLAQKQKKDPTNATNDNEVGSPQTDKKEALSRGQRKRLAKREQYLKREKMVMSSLRLQRLEDQKGKIDGLDAMREALGEAIAPASKHTPKSTAEKSVNTTPLTNKSKQILANTEISHMGLVLEHPSFKADPFAAIRQHLQNSLAPEAAKMKKESQKREEEDGEREAKKKEERKERLREAKFSKNKRSRARGFRSNHAGRIK